MTAILRYDAARKAVAEAKTFDEVREWEDKAAAVREYSRRVRDRSMELDAIEIRERARRRRGELLLAYKEAGQLEPGDPHVTDRGHRVVTLESLGVSRNESGRDQKIAALPGDSFERLIKRCREHAEATEKHAFNVLRPPDKPINGARSVMGSRQEPDDSLDFFPTPPWATRALFESVFPILQPRGEYLGSRVWEPACGAGHMAEVIREYWSTVIASDIFDYGYGLSGVDFLNNDHCDTKADWIITNPPFGDNGEKFALRAIELASVGVAMFFRLQWLESVGRYEKIFRDHPPRLIAQFTERVPLHKGRWEPEGSTATAYLWIVWMKGYQGRTEFFWIPPGQREGLSKADDVERFTAPVIIKKKHKLQNISADFVHPRSPMSEPALASAATGAGAGSLKFWMLVAG
jgi:hypothetical protein